MVHLEWTQVLLLNLFAVPRQQFDRLVTFVITKIEYLVAQPEHLNVQINQITLDHRLSLQWTYDYIYLPFIQLLPPLLLLRFISTPYHSHFDQISIKDRHAKCLNIGLLN